MSKFFKKNNRAFTLVETLVALSIFTVSILGLMSVLASGISNTNYAKQKMVATYLAQEGIEYVRNMRDTYVLYPGGGDWESFRGAISPPSHINPTFLITPPALSDTNFTRQIQVWTVSDDEVRIYSVVSWTQGSGNYQVTFAENLFD